MLIAVLAAAVVILVAACGGGDGDSASAGASSDGSVPAGASLVPASAVLVFTVNTDFDSEQWQAVEALSARFPGGAELIMKATAGLAADGLDFETDIKPALGPELDVVILDLPVEDDADPTIAVLTQPDDPDALQALLEQSVADSDDPPTWRQVDGWFVLADSDAVIDDLLADAEAGSLADDESFTDLIQRVSGDAALRVYLSGQVANQVVAAASDQSDQAGDGLGNLAGIGDSAVQSAVIAARAVDGGVAIEGLVRSSEPLGLETYEASIVDVVPGPAIGFVSFRDARGIVEAFLDLVAEQSPDFDMQIGQLETLTGISIEDDILPLFEGEHAIFVRGDSQTPEIGLVLSPEDPEGAVNTINQLLALFSLANDSGIERGEATVGDIEAKTVTVGETVVFFAAVGDHLVISNSEAGLVDFDSGTPLSEDPSFQEAQEASGMPDETAGFVFVDVAEARRFATLVPGIDIDQESLAALEPLGDVVLWAAPDGDDARFTGLIRIK